MRLGVYGIWVLYISVCSAHVVHIRAHINTIAHTITYSIKVFGWPAGILCGECVYIWWEGYIYIVTGIYMIFSCLVYMCSFHRQQHAYILYTCTKEKAWYFFYPVTPPFYMTWYFLEMKHIWWLVRSCAPSSEVSFCQSISWKSAVVEIVLLVLFAFLYLYKTHICVCRTKRYVRRFVIISC